MKSVFLDFWIAGKVDLGVKMYVFYMKESICEHKNSFEAFKI